MQVSLGSVSIDYACFGDPKHTPLLLIMGLASQRSAWPQAWIDAFIARDFYVITMDNRDIGLSTRFDDCEVITPVRAVIARTMGRRLKLAYELKDLALDASLLLAHLKVKNAHVLGVSMGGMVAQWLALLHPKQVSALTLIMTSSGYPWLPPPELAVLRFMSNRNSAVADPEAAVSYLIGLFELIGSPGFPTSPVDRRSWARAQVARSHAGNGALRQFAAIVSDSERWGLLGGLRLPVRVFHGEADPLIPIAHGRDLASRIANASFEAIPGMGHDLPPVLAGHFADHVMQTCASQSA